MNMKKDKNKELNEENIQTKDNPFTQDIEEAAPAEEPCVETTTLQDELEAQKNQYIRLAADFDNYRKRQGQERECLLKYGAEETLKKLLPVLDTMERAQKSFREVDDPEKLKESFDAVHKQIIDALDKIGLKKIDCVGKEFDPNVHEAVMQTPTDDHEDHTVIAELQSGYKLHDRTVRPAMVNVAVKE